MYGHGGHLGHVTAGPFIQTFVPPSKGGFTCNLALIGQAFSEIKCLKNVFDRQQTRTTMTNTRALVYYKLAL